MLQEPTNLETKEIQALTPVHIVIIGGGRPRHPCAPHVPTPPTESQARHAASDGEGWLAEAADRRVVVGTFSAGLGEQQSSAKEGANKHSRNAQCPGTKNQPNWGRSPLPPPPRGGLWPDSHHHHC